MASFSKLVVDRSPRESLELLLQHTERDDIIFLALIFLTGFLYTKYIRDKPDPYHHLWFEKPQAAILSGKDAETRDIGRKLEESSKDLVIFWGSQSGTAEGLANRLVRDCRSRFGLDALAADLSDYDPESMSNIAETKFAIFLVSTYGEGDPSDNATPFLAWLGSNSTVRFPNLRYAAFGLGNKNYKYYNKVIDVIVEALDSVGAKSLLPVGKADDSNGGTDEDFTEWKQNLFSLFKNDMGLKERPEQYEPTMKIVQDTSLELIDLHAGEPVKSQAKKGNASTAIEALTVSHSKKLLSTVDRNCLHLEVDTSDFPELKYKTGDHIAIWPSNPTSEIERLAKVLGLQDQLTTPLLISSLEESTRIKVPSPTTWAALLEHYLEICAPVPREMVLSLAQFASSPKAKETLRELGSDKDAYHSYCANNHVTLGRLLESVSTSSDTWSTLPTSFVLESLPYLSPRYYSISSSSIISPKKISLTIATSTSPSPGCSIAIPSLTTNYLLAISESQHTPALTTSPSYNLNGPNNLLENGSKVFAQIRTSKFRLPTVAKRPIIMIGAGSGVAPFRAFLQERARLSNIGREVGPSLLFFGCRSASDFLYKDEFDELVAEHGKNGMQVHSAYSRVEGAKKTYVQDKIEEMDQEVIRLLLEEDAYFYICGSASMARDVSARLGQCLTRRMNWAESDLRSWSEGMKRTKRWQEDVWG